MFKRLLPLLLSIACWCFAAPPPTPEQFAGFRMGADKKLLRWDKIVDYMKVVAAASPRVRVEEVGKTTMGNPWISVIVSSPETLANLARYRDNQKRLAYPRALDEAEAEKVMAANKAVLLITCNIHSTEIGSSQMVLELVHRLATEDSPFVRNVLDNVILVLVPSFNPDGQIMISDWYNQHAGTPWEYSPFPELYHKYTGHDDNRDAYMNTQIESKLFNKLAFKDWFPVVYLDEHQMGPNGPRIFVPPFMNPINMNVDPTIWELNGMLGYAMGAALNAKDYTGVITDAQYTSWWQGGFMMQSWWHNMVGLLTEVASVNIATPTEQLLAKSGEETRAPDLTFEQMQRIDPRKPFAAPRDVTPRTTYLRPWLGGTWTLRNIVDYELTATYGLLEAVANQRLMLQRNFYRLNRKQIALGQKEAPYAYVITADQHDPAAAARLAQLLDEQGGEVQIAGDAFQADGRTFPSGSYVVPLAQSFRPFVKDLLEKQTYPPQRQYPGGPIQRPYDVTGWTLPLQMGVEAVEIRKPFTAKLSPATAITVPPGKFEGGSSPVAYQISHQSNNAVITTNRLLKAGITVGWAPD
ncbi:MAG: M14 family metallopeptidase, partial [Acidobacteriota bacterium]|nr:M14 family metallopeptidase [Acidobacteriota bacterium]